MAILIQAAEVVVTMDGARRELAGCDIRVDGGVIVEVGAGLSVDGAEVIHAAGCVVTPGLVNTHHHLYQTCVDAPLNASTIFGTFGHVIRCGRVSGL